MGPYRGFLDRDHDVGSATVHHLGLIIRSVVEVVRLAVGILVVETLILAAVRPSSMAIATYLPLGSIVYA